MAGRLRPRRRLLVVAVVLALVALAVTALDQISWITSYRVVSDRTIVVTTTEGPGAWTRVGSVQESEAAVTIVIRSFRVQLGAGTGVGIPVDTVVTLREPLGSRAVIDGGTGRELPR